MFETAIFSNVYLFRIFFYYPRNHYHYLFRSFIVLEIRSFFTASPRVTTTILHDSMKIIDTSKRKIRATWNFNRGLNMLARKWTPNRRIWDGKKEKEKRKEKRKNDRRWGSRSYGRDEVQKEEPAVYSGTQTVSA